MEGIAAAVYPSLSGRSALVSGGATGLGGEFVRELAAQGAHVCFIDIDAEAGEALRAELAAQGRTVHFRRADVRDVDAVVAAVQWADDVAGPLRILVNNAANDIRRSIEQTDLEAWEEGMAVNLRHHFFAARTAAPLMRRAGGGSIINLGSISAHIDLTDLPAYITAKAGIEGLTRTLAREFGPDRIRVNCIIPGWVMTKRQLEQWVTPEAEEMIERNQCLPDRVMPLDVARLLLWLAADDSRMCTAQRWVVDGGWM